MNDSNIDIVLATYNGGLYIEEQLKSIQQALGYQELVRRLIVVDDGSTDDTHAIVKRRAKKDSRIEWHVNHNSKSNPKVNFALGISLSTAKYIMLSDQDDVWHKDKIIRSYSSIEPFDGPALIFSDKCIVNEKLEQISSSFFTYRNIPKEWHHSMERLLQQNVASGCAMMFNRQLLNKSLPIPVEAMMHDWWLVLVAKAIGDVVFIEQPLMDYRQHANNTIGAHESSPLYLIKNFVSHFSLFKKKFWQSVAQGEVLYGRYPVAHLENSMFVKLENATYWERLKFILSGKVKRPNVMGWLAATLTILIG